MQAERLGENKNETEGRPEFLLAMPMLIGLSTPDAVLRTVDWFRRMAQEAGYGGIKFQPTRTTEEQVLGERLTLDEKLSIKAAEQSFRTQLTWGQSKGIFQKLAFIAFPQRDRSLEALRNLCWQTNTSLPVVVYPETPKDILHRSRIPMKLVQPSSATLGHFGLNSLQEYLRFLWSIGVNSFCFDTHHARRGPIAQYWDELLEQASLVEISFGRIDIPDPQIPAMAELDDILFDKRNTEAFQILKKIKDSGFRGNFIVEVPLLAIELHLKRPLTRGQIIKYYKQILENVGSVLS